MYGKGKNFAAGSLPRPPRLVALGKNIEFCQRSSSDLEVQQRDRSLFFLAFA